MANTTSNMIPSSTTVNGENLPDIKPSLMLDFAKAKTVDPRVDFTRSSTATYWDGKTQVKAEENLMLYSQDFSQGVWQKTAISISGTKVTAPDGSLTAESVTSDGSNSEHRIVTAGNNSDPFATLSGAFAFSAHFKADTQNYIQVRTNVSANGFANFDLSAGTAHATDCTAEIIDVGNGWYRCIFISDASTGQPASVSIQVVTSTSSPRSEANSLSTTVEVWGAQLEQRDHPTAYTSTTAAPVIKYQPVMQTASVDQPRIDHDPVTGECLGLLVEEQRTNLVPYSAASVANWSTVGAICNATNQNALGLFDGVSVVSNGQVWNTVQAPSFTATDGVKYAVTAFVQKASSAGFVVHFNDNVAALSSSVTVSWGDTQVTTETEFTGAISDTNIEYITETIAKVSFVVTKSGTSGNVGIRVGPYSTTAGDTVIALGAQVEEGAFPTSYIPTSGSQVTRARDDAHMTDLSMFPLNEFTLYVEARQPPLDQWRRVLDVGDTSGSSNTNTVSIFGNPDGDVASAIRVMGVNASGVEFNLSNNSGDSFKAALAIAEDDVGFSVNGGTVLTDTTVNLAGMGLTRIWIGKGNEGFSSRYANAPISKIAIYPKRLTNSNIQAMTEA